MPSHKMDTYFKKLENINRGLKTVLENEFGKKYLSFDPAKTVSETSGTFDLLKYFSIDKTDASIKNKINSAEKLNTIKTTISVDFEKFSQDVIEYYQRVFESLDEQTGKSISIIAKTINGKKKRLTSALNRFVIQDNWDVAELASEFELSLVKFLKELISNVIQPISRGLQATLGNDEHIAYQDILKMFNVYLIKLGIYTTPYKEGHKLSGDDWHKLNPIDTCETEDKALKDVIKTIHSYPYFIGDDTLVLEGDVILWRLKRG